MHPLFQMIILGSICGVPLQSHWKNDTTVRLTWDRNNFTGNPVAWDQQQIVLLQRDGQLKMIPTSEVKAFEKVSDSFRAYSQAEMRGHLQAEFGRRFHVSGTGSYLVVHPAGQRDVWAARFEELYRSFVHYFNARGLPVQQPQFPLIAVVFPSREEFLSYARRTGDKIGHGVVGYYSPRSNRILLYDQTTANGTSLRWKENADTIAHEAAHQSAFNTGIHQRFAQPPRWVTEGLGTMFEATGVWNSRQHPNRSDRINRGRLAWFKRYVQTKRPAGQLGQLISSDRLFQSDPDGAYSEAWALTFYLAETQPRKYAEYLRLTTKRSPFSTYRSPERLRDFQRVFGSDLKMIEARMLRFIESLD